MNNYEQLYNELLEACRTWHGEGYGWLVKAPAYQTIVDHMTGRAKDQLEDLADDLLDDYDETIADFIAGTR